MNFDRFELRPLLQALFRAQDGLSELTFWSYSMGTHQQMHLLYYEIN